MLFICITTPPPILFWVNENRVNTENINIQTQILFNPKHKNTEIKIISTIYKPKRDLLKKMIMIVHKMTLIKTFILLLALYTVIMFIY